MWRNRLGVECQFIGDAAIVINPTSDQFKKAVEHAGGKLTGYVTAGPYDAVEILDVPNDDAALAMLLGSLSIDAAKFMSLRAFPEDQVKQALKKTP